MGRKWPQNRQQHSNSANGAPNGKSRFNTTHSQTQMPLLNSGLVASTVASSVAPSVAPSGITSAVPWDRVFTACLLLVLCLYAQLPRAQELQIFTEDWPPVSFGSGTKAEGMAVEVVQALQAHIGNTQPIQVVPWARGYKALLEEPNTLLFTVGRSEEREKLMVLLGPIAISTTSLYTRKGNAAHLQNLGDEIQKLKVGAYRSSIFADTARKKGFQNIEQAPTPQIIANMLLAKRFDLWVEGSLVVSSVLKDIGHSTDEVEKVKVLDSLELYLAFSGLTPASTIKIWEDALRWLKKEGSFAKIHQKWLPNEAPPMAVLRLDPPGKP